MGANKVFEWEEISENKYTALLTRDADGISRLVENMEEILGDLGCHPIDAQQMAIVAEELLTNISHHAWPESEAHMFSASLIVDAKPTGFVVHFSTEDDGLAYDPLSRSEPDLEASLEDREIGGLGIHMVRNFTDRQNYQRLGQKNIFEVQKTCRVMDED